MTESGRPQFRLSAAEEADVAQYHAISLLAVLGLILGLAAPLAVLNPVLAVVPLAGIATSGLALYRISRAGGALIGYKAALGGLLLSVACGAAAVGDRLLYQALVRDEARRFAAEWFAALRDGKPEVAFELTRPPADRRPLDDKLAGDVFGDFEAREAVRQFVADRTVAALLALGPKARVRYYETADQGAEPRGEVVWQTYAVTFDTESGPSTFFVELVLERFPNAETGQAYWQIMRASGGIQPRALGGPPPQTSF
jgi:hypothetical protein